MLKILYALILIVGIFIVYNFFNPPRSAMVLYVPVSTLDRLGIKDNEIKFMLSPDNSCKHELSDHNYTVMFGNVGNWGDIKVWAQHVTLYLTWRDIWKITDKTFLCIQSKGSWEAAWEGSFSLKGSFNLYVTHMFYFCNKNSNSSKWECNGYDSNHDKKEEIYKLLTKYDM